MPPMLMLSPVLIRAKVKKREEEVVSRDAGRHPHDRLGEPGDLRIIPILTPIGTQTSEATVTSTSTHANGTRPKANAWPNAASRSLVDVEQHASRPIPDDRKHDGHEHYIPNGAPVGHEVKVQQDHNKIARARRAVDGAIRLFVPRYEPQTAEPEEIRRVPTSSTSRIRVSGCAQRVAPCCVRTWALGGTVQRPVVAPSAGSSWYAGLATARKPLWSPMRPSIRTSAPGSNPTMRRRP